MSDVFPITIEKRSGRAPSSSGGKDYHLILITTNDHRAMTIARWAKKDQWGHGWDCKTYHDPRDARRFFEEKSRAKFTGEYHRPLINGTTEARDSEELRRIVGDQYWQKIPSSDLTFLLKQEIGAPPIPSEPEVEVPVEENIRNNANWGLF
jgi:hypothetical protein